MDLSKSFIIIHGNEYRGTVFFNDGLYLWNEPDIDILFANKKYLPFKIHRVEKDLQVLDDRFYNLPVISWGSNIFHEYGGFALSTNLVPPDIKRTFYQNIAAEKIQRNCAAWIDKPITKDGMVGISCRILKNCVTETTIDS